MRLIVFVLSCAVSVNFFGCAHHSAPKPPPLVECDLIAVAGGDPYLKCQWSTGGDVWRVSIKNLPNQNKKYLCTDDASYAKAWQYAEALDRWIMRECK